MADLKIALAKKRLKTIATGTTATGDAAEDAVTLAAGQIFLGQQDFDVETIKLVSSDEFAIPKLYILRAALGFAASTSPLSIELLLELKIRPTLKTWSSHDNLLEALRARWINLANYPPVSGVPPVFPEVRATEVQWPRPVVNIGPNYTQILQEIFVLFNAPF